MSSDDRRRAIGKVTSVAADRFVIEMLGGTDNFTVVGFDDLHYVARLGSFLMIPAQSEYVVAEVVGLRGDGVFACFDSGPALGARAAAGFAVMAGAFALDAVLLVFFISRISANLRRRDARVAALRQRAAEEDHIVRMGLLASGAAHELGTPLATLDVILGDWPRMPKRCKDPPTQGGRQAALAAPLRARLPKVGERLRFRDCALPSGASLLGTGASSLPTPDLGVARSGNSCARSDGVGGCDDRPARWTILVAHERDELVFLVRADVEEDDAVERRLGKRRRRPVRLDELEDKR